MTLTQIIAERPEIGKAVYEHYPVSKAEKKCQTEKSIMDNLRWKFAKRLMVDEKEKQEYKSI